MNLTETKNKVAQDLGYDDWKELVKDQSSFGDAWFDLIVTNVAELHATEKVKEALPYIAERARILLDRDFPKPHKLQIQRYSDGEGSLFMIDKDSILSLETELIETINKEI